MPPTRFIPPAPLPIRPSGFVRPSGALSVAQVANAQAILTWFGYLPRNRSSITGARDAATAGAVSVFQRQYNAENACRRNPTGAGCHPPYSNNGFQPERIAVDGDLGPEPIAALANYNQTAARGGYGIGLTPAQIEAAARQYAAGVGSGPAAVTNEIETTSPRPPAPAPRPAPAPAPAPQRQAASTFPTGPAIAVGVGAAVILAAVLYKRSRKGRKGGG